VVVVSALWGGGVAGQAKPGVGLKGRRPPFGFTGLDAPDAAGSLGGQVPALNLPLNGEAGSPGDGGYLGGGQHMIRVTGLLRQRATMVRLHHE
jgi:hypothetical protein